MSETASPIAEAMASMEAAEPQRPTTSAPQAEPIAETQAESPAPSASVEPTADDSQEDAHGTPSRAEKRIQQLLAKEREAREEAAYYRGIAQQNQRQTAPEPQQQPQQAQLPPDLAQYVGKEPDPSAFPAGEFDPNYMDARVDYKLKQREASQELARRHQAVQQQQANFHTKVQGMVAEGSSKYEDFAAKALSADVPMTAVMVREIAESDVGVDVAYFLGNNPAEAKRIAALPANRVAKEIGRIEARLEAAKAAPVAQAAPPPQPSATPPPPPRAPRGGASAGFDWASASPDQIQARINGK